MIYKLGSQVMELIDNWFLLQIVLITNQEIFKLDVV